MTKTINQMAKEVKIDNFISSLNDVLNEVGTTFYKKGAYAVIDRLEQIIQSDEKPAILYPKIVEAINDLKGEYPVQPKEIQLIDLGLPSGTLWADRNLGADAPERGGDYFRFGETTPFTEDSPEYVYDSINGNIAGTDRDAATAILGENYYTPKFEQIKELLDNCEQEWTTINEVNGIKITGPNGNSIFFPAAGYSNYSSGALSNVGSYGYFWSATPYGTLSGHVLGFNSSSWRWNGGNRASGFSVRPVAERKSK